MQVILQYLLLMFIVVIKQSEVCTVLMEGRAPDMLSSRHMFSSLLLILLVHTTILREVCFGGRQMEKALIPLLQGRALQGGRGQLLLEIP